MKEKIILLAACFLSICFLVTSPLSASTTKVIVEGYGVSRQDALLQAKRDAVAQGIGTLLVSETEVRNFMLQKDFVVTKTMGSVKSYSVLTERSSSPGDWYVQIEAEVSLATIKTDLMALQILMESMARPRMMVLIGGQESKQVQNIISDYLTAKHFDLVDPATVAVLAGRDESLIQQALKGNPLAVARLGAENGAEYVLTGATELFTVKHDMLAASGLASIRTSLTVKVIDCSTGAVAASKSVSSVAAHLSPETARLASVEKAARKLMDEKLFEQIVSSFQNMVNNGFPINVLVKNVTDYALQKKIRQRISETDSMAVHKRGFGGGELTLNVVYRGNADSFCEAIDSKLVGDKKIAVLECTGNNVVLVIRP